MFKRLLLSVLVVNTITAEPNDSSNNARGCNMPMMNQNSVHMDDKAINIHTHRAISAVRDPKTHWKDALKSNMAKTKLSDQKMMAQTFSTIPMVNECWTKVADVDIDTLDIPILSNEQMWEAFRHSRDNRFIVDDIGFLRKPTWLYPADYCNHRAELVAISMAEAGWPRPYKLYARGNLTFNTEYAVEGSVSWSYHVAPVVKNESDGKLYVFDPTIDPNQPLFWLTWLNLMLPDIENDDEIPTLDIDSLAVVIADSGAFHLDFPVTGTQPLSKEDMLEDSYTWRAMIWERNNLEELGRNPIVELGYFPPWTCANRDFNADRKSDIVWRHPLGLTSIWYLDHTTLVEEAYLPNIDTRRFSGTSDFNRDGKTDIVWYDNENNSIQIWLMINRIITGIYTLYDILPESSGFTLAGADDFNYDGKGDLIWYNSTTGTIKIWYLNNNLDSYISDDLNENMYNASSFRFAGTGDFNSDGQTDILWHNDQNGELRCWYLNKDTVIGKDTLFHPAPSGWAILALQDFNYDGNTDIMWYHEPSGAFENWLMNGGNGLEIISTENLPYTMPDFGDALRSIRIDAEDPVACSWISGTEIDNNYPGFTGTGFVNTPNATGAWTQCQLTVPVAGVYQINIRYANGKNGDRGAQLSVNGSTVATGTFANTGSWSTWSDESFANISLPAGTHTIRLTATTSNGLANIDHFDFATLDIEYHSLQLSTSGNGSIQSSKSGTTLPEGTVITLTAQPDPGFQFVSWDGDETGTDNPLTITLDCGQNITAIFAAMPAPDRIKAEDPFHKKKRVRQLTY